MLCTNLDKIHCAAKKLVEDLLTDQFEADAGLKAARCEDLALGLAGLGTYDSRQRGHFSKKPLGDIPVSHESILLQKSTLYEWLEKP